MFNRLQDMLMPMANIVPMGQPKLAEAYIPYQQYTTSYSPEEALHHGTMFPELYRPYEKREGLLYE